MNDLHNSLILSLPPEILLHIFSFLDLPDLSNLARLSPVLACLAEDPALHRIRLRIVAPSRVEHSLFGTGPSGIPLRPTFSDLVHRGIICGLGVERRWRAGLYFYSRNMVTQYESSLRLQRTHAGNVVESVLRRRSPSWLSHMYSARGVPDEARSASISPLLFPAMRRLKWSIRRDRFARLVRDRTYLNHDGGIAAWLDGRGKAIMRRENERVRLALCPGVSRIIKFYESLA